MVLGKIKKSSSIRVFLIVSGFILMIAFSEFLFIFKNNDNFRIGLYLYLTHLSATTQNLKLSVNFLGKAAEIRFNQMIKKYPEIEFESVTATIAIPESEELKSEYLGLLENIDYKLMASSDPKYLSKVFYQLGLLSFENNENDLVIPLWRTAAYLAPEWSYFQIELANYYLSIDDKESAENQLVFCQKFTYPEEQCNEYKKSNFEVNKAEPVGFLEKDINGL